DLVAREIHVFHAQTQTFHDAHAAAVKQTRQQPRPTVHRRQQAPHFVRRQHRRHTPRALRADDVAQPRRLDPQHLAVQEKNRRQSLVLRARRDIAERCKTRQERFDIATAQLTRMTRAARQDEPANPAKIRLLRAQTVVFVAQLAANFVHQTRTGSVRLRAYYTRIFALATHYAPKAG